MKILAGRATLLRSNATVFALAAGLLTAIVCWCWLPPTPLFREIEAGIKASDLTCFSPRMNYAVYTFGGPGNKNDHFDDKNDAGSASVWDLRTCEMCFSFRYSGMPDIQFNEDETLCVEFNESSGQARLRDMPNGVLKSPDHPLEFPRNSRLLADAKGRLFVLSEGPIVWQIRDLLTGDEVGNYSLPPNKTGVGWRCYPGVLQVRVFKEMSAFPDELRQVPTGQVLWQDRPDAEWDDALIDKYRVTPDGKTSVRIIEGKVRGYDKTSGQRAFAWPARYIDNLSADGRYPIRKH